MTTAPQVRRPLNSLLADLPEDEWSMVVPHLREVQLRQGQVLHEVGEPIEAIYFMEDSLASLIAVLLDDTSSDGAMIGRYGAVGLYGVAQGSLAPGRAMVQVAGTAARMPVDAARDLLPRSPHLLRMFQLWENYTLAQTLQTSACNTAHSLRARLARWLLEVADQLGEDSFAVTQDFLAEMLGASRPTVSVIAAERQAEGLISYSRGHLSITDRPALEAEACECYGSMRERFGALFGKRESEGTPG